jgi:hypothetical protein
MRTRGREQSPITLIQFDQSLGVFLSSQRRMRINFIIGDPEKDLLTRNIQSLEQYGVQWGDEIATLSSRGTLRLLGLLETGWDENASLIYGVFNGETLVRNLRHSPARISGPQEKIERVFGDIGNLFNRLPED